MKTLQKLKWFLACALVIVATLFVFRPSPTGRNDQAKPSPSPQQVPAGSPSATSLPATASKSDDPESVEELSALVRKLAAQGGDANTLFLRIVPMQLPKQAWWVNSTDFSSLLAVATDAGVSEAGRVVALRLFLAGVPKSELEKQADSLQATFAGASDSLVGAILQGMANRGVAPSTLIQETLTNPQREDNTKCLGWYAAKMTDLANPAFASLAISQSGDTASSKVAFDYLAAAPYSAKIASDPTSQKSVDKLVEKATNLPPDAGIIEMANADALIAAMPKIMEGNRAKETFLSLLHNAPNPEVRLSALDQIIILQMSGKDNLSVELSSIKKNFKTLFPDESVQIRANARLNRIP